jgi:hypothetical protein
MAGDTRKKGGLIMQIAYFETGGFVAHKYRIPWIKSKFSVWFNRDGFAIDACRIDARNRCFPVNRNSPAWQYIERNKIAGLDSATAIEKSHKTGV